MNQSVILVLDGALYIAAFILLVIVAAVCAKLAIKHNSQGTAVTAFVCVGALCLLKGSMDYKVGTFLPDLSFAAQLAIGAAVTWIAAVILFKWRYDVAVPAALAIAVAVVGCQYALTFAVPKISARVLPEGPRLAEFIDSASARTRKAREAALAFKKVNDAAASAPIASALDALATLSSKDEFDKLKTHFSGGVKFYADRKALMNQMTKEEIRDYQIAMAQFMTEQGLAQDRYSLAALQDVRPEDVANMVAFMKEMRSELTLPASTAPVRPPAESLQILMRNVRGMTFSAEDHATMASIATLFDAKELDKSIAKVRGDLAANKINPAWAGTFLAALLETKSHLPIATLMAPETTTAADGTSTADALVPVPTKFGVVRIPLTAATWGDWNQAASAIPLNGFMVTNGPNARVRVVVDKRSLGLGDTYRFVHQNKKYAFRVDEVWNGMVYFSSISVN